MPTIRRAGIVFPLVLDNQVLAHLVELVGIESGLVRALQTLAQFNIEDSKAKAAGRDPVFARLGQTKTVPPDLGVNAVRYRTCWKRRSQ